jgi:hypothetical protein
MEERGIENMQMAKEPGDDPEVSLCPFCAGKAVSETDLLLFAIAKLGITKEELEEQLLKEKKGEGQ